MCSKFFSASDFWFPGVYPGQFFFSIRLTWGFCQNLTFNINFWCHERSDFIWFFHLRILKFVYSEKATNFCEISTLLLSIVHTDKSKVDISQNFVAFSEYINFNKPKVNHWILRIGVVASCQKLGIILENKVIQRFTLSI